MLRKSLAATVASLFITVVAGGAIASPPASSRAGAAEQPARLTQLLTVLHAVSQWSSELSAMADKRAKSNLVKEYAHEMAALNSEKDAKLMAIAEKHEIDLAPLDPQTEEGRSMLDRMKAETVLLNSLQGDAFDKEYMTLVTNTQQSIIHMLEARRASVKEPDAKQMIGNLITAVQGRLKKAQTIMAKVYGDSI